MLKTLSLSSGVSGLRLVASPAHPVGGLWGPLYIGVQSISTAEELGLEAERLDQEQGPAPRWRARELF